MNASEAVRTAIFETISPVIYEGVVIPVYDEIVNPLVPMAVVGKATCYVILQDYQDTESGIQTMCNEDITANITIRVVTKFATANVATKTHSERIADIIGKKLRNGLDTLLTSPNINIKSVKLPVNRQQTEVGGANVAFSQIMIYEILLNL